MARRRRTRLSLPQPNAPPLSPSAVLTTRREALSLYRAIWRATRWFAWPDARGVPFRDALRASARSEFDAARAERDPVLVARMLVVGRDALAQALERLAAKAAAPPPPGGGEEGRHARRDAETLSEHWQHHTVRRGGGLWPGPRHPLSPLPPPRPSPPSSLTAAAPRPRPRRRPPRPQF